jgi:hypothetical protein
MGWIRIESGGEDMRHKRLILAILFSCGVLAGQIGCQPDNTIVTEPETKLAPGTEGTRPLEAQITEQEPRTVRQEPKTVGQESKQKGPRIKFEKLICDLGDVGPSTKNACRFRFKNAGDTTLRIIKVDKACGCTPYSLDKKEYAPGESGVIRAAYNASPVLGPVTRKLYVNSNDKNNPKIGLTIKANIALKVRHSPTVLKLSLKQEDAGCDNITLTSVDGKPFSIKSFKAPKQCITASFDPAVKATEFVLEPKADVEALAKNLKGTIRIEVTHPKCKLVKVEFDVVPRFSITPSARITTRNAVPQKPIPRQVWIVNNYDEDFEIESTSSTKNIIRVVGQRKVGKRHKLDLHIVPPAAEGKRRTFSDVLHVKLKDDERLLVRCYGWYPAPKRNKTTKSTHRTGSLGR